VSIDGSLIDVDDDGNGRGGNLEEEAIGRGGRWSFID